jgi:parallel beta-helix repeat protein
MTACAAPETPELPTPTRTPRPTSTPRFTPTATLAPLTPVTTAAPGVVTTPQPAGLPLSTPSPTISPTPAPSSTATQWPTPSATPQALGGCAEIWRPGYYVLTNDIKIQDTHDKRYDCMIIKSSDVVVNCDNHSIEGIDYNGFGFRIHEYGFPFLTTPNDVEIRNCKVFKSWGGVIADSGTNLWIHDNDFSNNRDDTDKRRYGIFLGLAEGGGIRLDNVQGARIENNTANNAAVGIDVRNSTGITIHNNTAANNSAWGVNLLNTQQSEVSGNTLRDNVRYCTWGSGVVDRGCDAGGIILQDGASQNVIKDNAISGQNGGGIFIKAHGTRCGDDNLIQNNKITDALYNGIELGFCKGNKIIGNEITGSFDGVWFSFAANTEVRNNTISNMRNHGINSFNSRGSIIANNQVTNSREGILFSWGTYDPKALYFLTPSPDQYASRDNAISGNALKGNVVAGIHLMSSTNNQVTNNTFASNAKNVWVEGKNDGNVVTGQ